MSDELTRDVQKHLFQTQLAWQEFPLEVRQVVRELLSLMCTEIVEESSTRIGDRYDEPRRDSPLAP
jgi:hypothetical protein